MQRSWMIIAAILCLGACAEDFSIAKLVDASFGEPEITVEPGASHTVHMAVICDGDQVLRVSLADDTSVPDSLTLSVSGLSGTPECLLRGPNVDYETDDLTVVVHVGEGTPGGRYELAFDVSGDHDVAAAFLIVNVPADLREVPNLLVNSGFESGISPGFLPSQTGNWQGDASALVGEESGITPHDGAHMVRFDASGTIAGPTVSSQLWQLVDVTAAAGLIGSGTVKADASAWFNRVVGGAGTDRRFDVRVLAFDGATSAIPEAYAGNLQLGVAAGSVITTGNVWQQATAHLDVPVGTTLLLVEVYAYEDVQNDTVSPEFDGHFVDDVKLTLSTP